MLSITLKKLRENCGYTQQQIAEALNIDRSTYAYYESGKTTPDINTIIKLSKIFNVPYTEIFENEENYTISSVSDVQSEEDEFSSQFGRKQNTHIYELSKKEQQIIIGFRLLSKPLQDEVLDVIYCKAKNLSKKKKQ